MLVQWGLDNPLALTCKFTGAWTPLLAKLAPPPPTLCLFYKKKHQSRYVLNILTTNWVLHTPKSGWSMLFQVFAWKTFKRSKTKEKEENWGKKCVFWACTQRLVKGFFWENLWPGFGCNPKKNVFASFCQFFFSISSPYICFLMKNLKKHVFTSFWSGQHPNASTNIHIRFTFFMKKCEKLYFDRCLECAASKGLSKYISEMNNKNNLEFSWTSSRDNISSIRGQKICCISKQISWPFRHWKQISLLFRRMKNNLHLRNVRGHDMNILLNACYS